jgi:hypothetical protein
MSKILYNPTNEELRTMYVGEDVILAPEAMVKVDDQRGRQVLNVLAPRGLVELEFGDDADNFAGKRRKAEIGRERNRAFKRKQVMDFNAINDRQQQRRLPYLTPEPFLKEYARELGLELYEPYSSKNQEGQATAELLQKVQEKDDMISEMRKANEAMQNEISEMRRIMQKLLVTSANAGGNGDGAEKKDDWEDVRRVYKGINRTHFANWVGRNFEIIQGYPADIQAEIKEKFERLYNEPYPATALEATASLPV